ncbi:MAG: hemolysin III family protein [Gammaproteobacteria bacterium]|nr:hemolysin III family protein [Gammaproteobacteria bacterium]MDH5346219.1 hemolysin III family protein [Gammaproteobacteria bacterium]
MITTGSYSPAEERAHVLTHAVGLVLSIAGLTWMLYTSLRLDDPWRIVASVVYGSSLISLFGASTVYHYLYDSLHRPFYKLLDHCAIYLLIAGTYTPFILISMRNSAGWWLFTAIWTLATAGIIKKIWIRHRYPRFSLISYLAMGWLCLLAGPQLMESISNEGVLWLAAGGLAYTFGTVFYMRKQMLYHHAIWHVFVLVGAACHFLAIAVYVLPVTKG